VFEPASSCAELYPTAVHVVMHSRTVKPDQVPTFKRVLVECVQACKQQASAQAEHDASQRLLQAVSLLKSVFALLPQLHLFLAEFGGHRDNCPYLHLLVCWLTGEPGTS